MPLSKTKVPLEMLSARRTIVVHTKLAGHMSRVDAARHNEAGVQVMTMGQLAARLAGGLLQPVDLDVLTETIWDALPDVEMGELEPIKDLPGMPAAVTATFDKAWRAGVVLSEVGHPRTAALASLEQMVFQRLPASMKRPGDLVALALQRVGHAPAVIGQLEIHGHSEMSPCWRRLLIALAESVQVSWIAGPRHVPEWLKGSKVGVVTAPPAEPPTELFSCANQLHEVGEAFRWMRVMESAQRSRRKRPAGAARRSYLSPLRPKPLLMARCNDRKMRKTGIVARTAIAICSVGG